MTFDPSDFGFDAADLDCTDAERWADWEPSAEECRDMIDAENERRYDAWLDYGDPFDFTGASYAEEWDEPRAATDWERDLEQMIEDACRRSEEGKASIILDRGDLDWMGAFDEECLERRQGIGDEAPKIEDMGLFVEILAAGSLIHKRDQTFWPRLRKLGATPAMVREANHLLHGADHQDTQELSPTATPTISRRRTTCSRARSSRGAAPARRQGSRRVTASSRASPSDDDGESEPPGLRLWRHSDRRSPLRGWWL